MTEEKSLIVGTDLTAVEIYTPKKMDILLKEVEKKVSSVVLPDTSTDKNRKEIVALAYKITQTKAMIEKAGLKITEGWREKTKEVNQTKKTASEFLTKLAQDTRQSVTEWEEAEKERTRKIAKTLEYFTMSRTVAAGTVSAVIQEKIIEVDGYLLPLDLDHDTLEDLAAEREQTLEVLRHIYGSTVVFEKEKIELDTLRKEKEEREQKELAEAAEKRQKEEEEKAEKARIAKAEQDEKDRIAKEEQDEKDRLANEDRIRKEEQEKATREAEEKIAREKREREEADRLEKEAEEKRIADVNHRNRINGEAITSIVSLGIADEDTASAIVEAISQDQVDHITIRY